MYISVRSYRGAHDLDQLERLVVDGFIPLMRNSEGFLDYYFTRTGDDSYFTVSIFETRQQADASIRMAAEWIRKYAMPLAPNPPEITTGEVTIDAHANIQPSFDQEPAQGSEELRH